MIYNQQQFNQYHLGSLQHQQIQQFMNQHENVYQTTPYTMIQHPHIIHHPVSHHIL
jgi:hypothetical protein